jgi:hypothetical protein
VFPRVQIEGVTGKPRHALVFEVKEKIHECGGSVLDYQQFSNRLMRLTIEVAAGRLGDLITLVEDAGLSLSGSTVEAAIAAAKTAEEHQPGTRITGTLAVRFMSDEPDLRVPAPPIPG